MKNTEYNGEQMRFLLKVSGVGAAIALTTTWLMVGNTAGEAAPEEIAPPKSSVRYQLTVLKLYSSGGNLDINNTGQIVGFSEYLYRKKTDEWPTRAYHSQGSLLEEGKVTNLKLPGKYIGANQIMALNDLGQIVGTSQGRAFIWQKGTFKFLPFLPPNYTQSLAYDINNRGQVVGEDNFTALKKRAVLWENGRERDLGTLPGNRSSRAWSINNRGQIVGDAFTEWVDINPQNVFSAVLWENGKMHKLPGLANHQAAAKAINDKGQIVGWADPASISKFYHGRRAVMWQNGKLIDLGEYPDYKNVVFGRKLGQKPGRNAYSTEAVAINNRGQIVGNVSVQNGCVAQSEAFLWEDGKMKNLTKLLLANSGWRLLSVSAINDHGQIIAEGILDEGIHSVLLTPTNAAQSAPVVTK